MSVSSRRLSLVAILLFALAIGCFLIIGQPPRLEGDHAHLVTEQGDKQVKQDTSIAAAPLQPALGEVNALDFGHPVTDARTVEAPTEAARPKVSASAVRSPSALGRLKVRGIDLQSKAPLDRIRVRAMSSFRLADRESAFGESEIELALTTDTYSLLILSQGYEPTELPAVLVKPGETVVLDPVALRAGSARIMGVVTGDSPPDQVLRVQLMGEGRRPCASCSMLWDANGARSLGVGATWTRNESCPACGYSANVSRQPTAPGSRFTFENLASGPYALLLIDSQARAIGLPVFFDLHVDESLPIELESTWPRTLFVEIIDTDGKSLASEWANWLRGEGSIDSDLADGFADSDSPFIPVECRCSFRAGQFRVANATFTTPTPPDPTHPGHLDSRPAAFGSRRLGSGAKRNVASDDRPRGNSEVLRPEIPAPTIKPFTVDAAVDDDGLVRMDPLPSMSLSLDVTCGPFTATASVPASRSATHVLAVLSATASAQRSDGKEVEQGPRTFREFEAGRKP